MHPYHLIIGDNSELLSHYSIGMFSDSLLITNENHTSVPIAKAYYTSLADVDWNTLLDFAKKANTVIYCPPVKWHDNSFRTNTEKFLSELIIHHNITVKNFAIPEDPTSSLLLWDKRKTDASQLWIAGCSYAYGYGLPSNSNRYIDLISTAMNKPYSDLTSPGSSISWAADQILRSDIRKNDTVVWGITSVNRVDYYIDNQYIPMMIDSTVGIDELSNTDRKLLKKLVVDDNRLNQSIKSVHQVINFLERVQAEIVLLYHSELSIFEHSRIFEPYLWHTGYYVKVCQKVDFTDDGHPGVETNKLWADQLLSHINRNC